MSRISPLCDQGGFCWPKEVESGRERKNGKVLGQVIDLTEQGKTYQTTVGRKSAFKAKESAS